MVQQIPPMVLRVSRMELEREYRVNDVFKGEHVDVTKVTLATLLPTPEHPVPVNAYLVLTYGPEMPVPVTLGQRLVMVMGEAADAQEEKTATVVAFPSAGLSDPENFEALPPPPAPGLPSIDEVLDELPSPAMPDPSPVPDEVLP